MSISIIIETKAKNLNFKELQRDVCDYLHHLRFAGGTIWGARNVAGMNCGEEADEKRLLRLLMPGFVLIERRDLIEEQIEMGMDALDALLNHLEICRVEDEDDETVSWRRKSEEPGWIVPISVGYRAISETGQVKNQRDPDCLHCFAENVVTLGEFVLPTRLDKLDEMLWQANLDYEQGLYVYENQNKGE